MEIRVDTQIDNAFYTDYKLKLVSVCIDFLQKTTLIIEGDNVHGNAKQAYIPIGKIIGTSKQSASAS